MRLHSEREKSCSPGPGAIKLGILKIWLSLHLDSDWFFFFLAFPSVLMVRLDESFSLPRP